MSIRVMNLVWAHSEHKGSDLLTLLAISDNADDDGLAFPGIDLLASKTRLSVRGVKYAVERLLAGDELDRLERGGFRGHGGKPSVYRVNVQTLQEKPLRLKVQKATAKVQDEASEGANGDNAPYREPSVEPSVEPTSANPDVERLCQLMADLSNQRTDPDGVRPKPKYTVTKGGREAMRRLIDIDGRSADLIERAIRWVDQHDFWRKNILSPEKLRKQFDTIYLEAQKGKPGRGQTKADRVQSNVEALRAGAKQ